jgi:hypothetical protein
MHVGNCFALGLVLLLTTQSALLASGDIAGFASVVDGDSIEIRGERIRLHGIDAPESRQLCTRPMGNAGDAASGQAWRSPTVSDVHPSAASRAIAIARPNHCRLFQGKCRSQSLDGGQRLGGRVPALLARLRCQRGQSPPESIEYLVGQIRHAVGLACPATEPMMRTLATQQPEASTQEVLAGLIERVTYHNDENGFCVLRMKARGHRDLVTVVGHAAAISAGEWMTASGEWINDRTHGQQFRARFMRTYAPTSVDGASGREAARSASGTDP